MSTAPPALVGPTGAVDRVSAGLTSAASREAAAEEKDDEEEEDNETEDEPAGPVRPGAGTVA